MSWRGSLALAAVTLAACAMAPAAPPAPRPDGTVPLVAAETQRVVPETRSEITLSFAPVVRQAAPAVVNIFTRKLVERRISPFAGDPFFERFFRDMFPGPFSQRGVEQSLGSGVILDAWGIVVSNYHVVAGADEITVVLADRREFAGEVIFADRESDLAVIRLENASGLPTLTLRDSDTLEVGDLVLAIGNPFGVGQTVTSGIISGLARSGTVNSGQSGIFIQTDAAINPGNSGGALVDMQGRLVGINTAILSRSGDNIGIGFAVPANLVARVVGSARQGHSALVRPWLGLDGQQVGGDIAAALGLAAPAGLLIDALHPDSPFALAGLERGDVITGLGGAPVNALPELELRAASRSIGETVRVDYLRRGVPDSASIRLAAAADRPPRDQRTLGPGDGLPGLTVANVNPALIDEVGLPVTSRGVLVLDAHGPARQVGLRPLDFIRKLDGAVVEDVSTLTRRLRSGRNAVNLEIERQGRVGQIRYRR